MIDSRSAALPSSTIDKKPANANAPSEATFRLTGSEARSALTALARSEPERDAPAGDPLRYQLLREIGRGGMGVVFRGFDRTLERELAVKVLLDEHLSDAETVRRFHREAWVVGQLQHPGIVPLYDVGRFASGQPYFVMRLIEGQTLAAHLARRSTPADDHVRLLKVFESICQTLAYAHSRGVVHRDLKPANVMVGEFGEVQVMDWGLARVLAGSDIESEPASGSSESKSYAVDATQVGDVYGTPAYMAPEQARGDVGIDERADVFGLGAILCEILTGNPPYLSAEPTEAIEQASAGNLVEARQRLVGCGADADLIALARDCLAADPAKRPANAGTVGQRLHEHLARVDQRARAADAQRAAAAARLREERKRRRLRLALAAAVAATALVATAGGLVVAQQRARRAEERAQFQQAKSDRDADAVRRVLQALDEAEALRTAARQAPDPLPLWSKAVAVVQLAQPLLTDDLAESDLAGRLRRTVAEMEQGERDARTEAADQRMLARIDEARLAQTNLKNGKFDMAGAAPVYAKAFREYGIDVEKLPQREAGELLIKRRIRLALSTALADWAITRRTTYGSDDSLAGKLISLSMIADTDAWRQKFYDAMLKRNAPEIVALSQSKEVASQPPATIFVLTEALRARGKHEMALSVVRRSLVTHPGDFWLNHQCAFLLVAGPSPDHREAARYLSVAVAIRPQSPGARVNLGCELQRSGDQPRAIEQFREAIRLVPDYADAHFDLGLSFVMLGQTKDGIASFKQALAIQPNHVSAGEGLGRAYNQLGDHKAAIEACRYTLKLDSNSRATWYHLSVALRSTGDRDGAIAAARRLADLDSQAPHAHYHLANVLDGFGKCDEAVKAFREAIRLNPDYAEAYCNMGHCFSKMGRNVEAFAAMSRGHTIGSKRADWKYDSAQWVKQSFEMMVRDLWPTFNN